LTGDCGAAVGFGVEVVFGVGFADGLDDGLGAARVVVGDGFGDGFGVVVGGTLVTVSVSGTRVTVSVGAVTVPVGSSRGLTDRVHSVGEVVATATGTAPPPGTATHPLRAIRPATTVPATTIHEGRGRGSTTRRTLASGASARVLFGTGIR
jgi:hypothetical protein